MNTVLSSSSSFFPSISCTSKQWLKKFVKLINEWWSLKTAGENRQLLKATRHIWMFNRVVFNWVSKVILRLLWFCFSMLCDWLPKFAPVFQPMRSKTKTNHTFLALIFPRLALVTCTCFEFWLVHCAVYVCCDWPEWLLWFWFYYTQLKTALIPHRLISAHSHWTKGVTWYKIRQRLSDTNSCPVSMSVSLL